MASLLAIFALFLVGVLLLAVEAFVIPGFGVTGILGIGVIGYASYVAWTEHDPLLGTTIAVIALVLAMGFLIWVPRSRMGKSLTLNTAITETTSYDEEAKRAGIAVGNRGRAATQLRPSGFAQFGEHRVEVRTEGEFIEVESELVVTKFKDGKVFVELVEAA